uniref:AlNc14C8G1065 protein n=1 Tax=Albugo laibachii Nc14 TaxID=890382 RepID=F0W1Y6_9STRA|nr:AlNc14C8G1065 [Albugo laibachii Nc14]|eukprot:CCA15065.1 AlNc14C8G1065 [Albugo laibachii Nc14]
MLRKTLSDSQVMARLLLIELSSLTQILRLHQIWSSKAATICFHQDNCLAKYHYLVESRWW